MVPFVPCVAAMLADRDDVTGERAGGAWILDWTTTPHADECGAEQQPEQSRFEYSGHKSSLHQIR